jgi:O-antigen ligase
MAALYGLVKFALGFHIKVMSVQSTTMTWGALATMFALVTTQVAISGATPATRWLARLLVIPQLLALLFSMVRGAYVGYVAGLAYLLARQWRRALPAAAIALMLALLFSPESLRQRALSIFDPAVTTTQVRLVQWRYALEIFGHHPFFGVGWRDLAAITRSYAPPGTNMSEGINFDVFHIGHFHSTYVTLLVCTGAVGVLAFLWLMSAVWRNLGRVLRETAGLEHQLAKAAVAAMVGFLVAGLFDWTFGDAEVVTMFWFVIGFGMGQLTRLKPSYPVHTTTAA